MVTECRSERSSPAPASHLFIKCEPPLLTDCCGCLVVVERGDQADLTCNECGAVVRTVPLERAAATLAEMESTEMCSARCTHCGALNTFLGFSAIEAFTCSECGEGVVVKGTVQ